MNPDGEGAKYWLSQEVGALSRLVCYPSLELPTRPWPDAITGILAHWVGFSSVIDFCLIVLLTCSHDTRRSVVLNISGVTTIGLRSEHGKEGRLFNRV